MKKNIKILLKLALLCTLAMFVHEWIYDSPGENYPLKSIILDILFAGTFYTLLNFGVLYLIYRLGEAIENFARKLISQTTR